MLRLVSYLGFILLGAILLSSATLGSAKHSQNDPHFECTREKYLTTSQLEERAKHLGWAGGAHFLVHPEECSPVGFCPLESNFPLPAKTSVSIREECAIPNLGEWLTVGKDCLYVYVDFPIDEILSMAKAKRSHADMYSSPEALASLYNGSFRGFTQSTTFLMDRCGNYLGNN